MRGDVYSGLQIIEGPDKRDLDNRGCTVLVGPTVYSSLVDVLLHFRFHCVALIADVSRMSCAIALTEADRLASIRLEKFN